MDLKSIDRELKELTDALGAFITLVRASSKYAPEALNGVEFRMHRCMSVLRRAVKEIPTQ